MELNIDDELKLEQMHVDDVYEQMAPHYCTIKQKAWPKVKDFLRNLHPGSIVADIGCGTGRYLGVNPDIFICGSDKCYQLVGHGRTRGYEVLAADNLNLPFKTGYFDAVISIGVIHHFSTRKRRVRALKELSRILKPGGKMMIYVWAFEQKSRKFECQDVLVPWKNINDSKHSKYNIEKDFPSSSSISEDDVFMDGVDNDATKSKSASWKQTKSCSDLPPTTPLKIKKLLSQSRSHSSQTFDLSELNHNRFQHSYPSAFTETEKENIFQKPNLAEECRKFEACLKALSHRSPSLDLDNVTKSSEEKYCNGVQKDGWVKPRTVGIHSHNGHEYSKSESSMTSLNRKSCKMSKLNGISTDSRNTQVNTNCGYHIGGRSKSDGNDHDIIDRDSNTVLKNGLVNENESKQQETFAFPSTFLNFRKKIPANGKIDLSVHTQTEMKRHLKHSNSDESSSFFDFEPLKLLKSFISSKVSLNKKPDQSSFSLKNNKTTEYVKLNEATNSFDSDVCKCYWYHYEESRKLSDEFAVREFPSSSLPSTIQMIKNKKQHSNVRHHSEELFNQKTKNGVKDKHLRKVSSASDIFSHKSNSNNLEFTYQGSDEALQAFGKKLSRYYHVFRENELSNLIAKYTNDLVTMETYYDHSNWCNIVVKKENCH